MLDQEKRYEVVDETRREERSGESFDRVAFAMRALEILRPERMKVVVYQRVTDLRVERALDLSRSDGTRYAIVGIPPTASREHIAYQLAELAGVSHVPFMLAVLTAC